VPSRTLEDKVDELSKLVAVLREQGTTNQTEIIELRGKQSETGKEVADLKTRMAVLERQAMEWGEIKEEIASLRDLKIPIAILERGVEELKRTKEEWSRRFWAMAGPILGAVVGVVLGYFLRR
jgi:VIT1/CCC1 family predicted Fe2+/Mn2+ transporter